MTVLVTGSSGFVGQELVPILRSNYNTWTVSLRHTKVGDIDLKNTQCIVHLAGKAHQMAETDPRIYFEINRDLTLELAKKAKLKGVKHFIFVSTVKVYGDAINKDKILDEYSLCEPADPYGKSKYEAEAGLRKLESDTFKIAVIRTPLIYGPRVKGNLDRLIKLIVKLRILPLGGIKNKRSMVYVHNLIAMIVHIINNSSSGVFIAGDRNVYSTTDLVKEIRKNISGKTYLFSLPIPIINTLRVLKPSLIKRLFDSFVVDNSHTNRKLGFDPPFNFSDGVKEMVKKDYDQ